MLRLGVEAAHWVSVHVAYKDLSALNADVK